MVRLLQFALMFVASQVFAQDTATDAYLAASGACRAAIEQELGEWSSGPGSIRDIRSVSRAALPVFGPRLHAAFVAAGEEAAKGERLPSAAVLYEITVRNLHESGICAGDHVIGIPEIVVGHVYRFGVANNPRVIGQFSLLGMTDSHPIRSALLLMLTAEASGLEWSPDGVSWEFE